MQFGIIVIGCVHKTIGHVIQQKAHTRGTETFARYHTRCHVWRS